MASCRNLRTTGETRRLDRTASRFPKHKTLSFEIPTQADGTPSNASEDVQGTGVNSLLEYFLLYCSAPVHCGSNGTSPLNVVNLIQVSEIEFHDKVLQW